jgi:hypothetical protein
MVTDPASPQALEPDDNNAEPDEPEQLCPVPTDTIPLQPAPAIAFDDPMQTLPLDPAAAAPLVIRTEAGVASDTSPPALPPAPPSTRTLPPIDAPWLLPALTDTSPPAPLAPCPTLMLTAPP